MPRPLLQREQGLLLSDLRQLEAQARRITGPANQTRWVIPEAAGMQKAEVTSGKIHRALVQIKQLSAVEFQGHGIHREVAASQVISQAS